MTGEAQKVLVVEDIRSTRHWLAEVAGNAFSNAEIDTADSLASAMAWLSAQGPGSSPICLVDLGLPDGSGIDFIGALMQRCPAARAVLTTLFDDDANLLNAMAVGAAGYILKDQEPELIGVGY